MQTQKNNCHVQMEDTTNKTTNKNGGYGGKREKKECQKTDTKTGKQNWQKGHDKNFVWNWKKMCWQRWGENQRKPVAVKAKQKGLTPVEKVMPKERKKKKCIGEKSLMEEITTCVSVGMPPSIF